MNQNLGLNILGLNLDPSQLLASASQGLQEGAVTQIMQSPQFQAQAKIVAEKTATEKLAEWIRINKKTIMYGAGALTLLFGYLLFTRRRR